MSTSTSGGVVKGLQRFVNEFRVPLKPKNIKLQMKEIRGLTSFGKGLYHCQNYENLMQNLKKSRIEYVEEDDGISREKIANSQLQFWKKYLSERKKDLPKVCPIPNNQEFDFTDKMKLNLKNSWDIVKPRNQTTMPPYKFIEMHKEYVNNYDYEIPIYPRILQRMIHPHFNYLSNLPNSVNLEEFFEMYSNFIAASYEESLGQELLTQELLALTFWIHVFGDKGAINIKELSDFLKIFRINISPNFDHFRKEFQFAISLHPKEFTIESNIDGNIIRFDFFRYLFLERNL